MTGRTGQDRIMPPYNIGEQEVRREKTDDNRTSSQEYKGENRSPLETKEDERNNSLNKNEKDRIPPS